MENILVSKCDTKEHIDKARKLAEKCGVEMLYIKCVDCSMCLAARNKLIGERLQ
jgi:hypothetical protein